MLLRRTAVVFAVLWAPLALLQCVRAATACYDGSGTTHSFYNFLGGFIHQIVIVRL